MRECDSRLDDGGTGEGDGDRRQPVGLLREIGVVTPLELLRPADVCS
ncbi:hypothetical protein AB0C59_09310 [Streptomyces sp. NPDC048664]